MSALLDERDDIAMSCGPYGGSPGLGSSRLVAGMLLLAVVAPACTAIYVALGSPVAIPPAVALVVAAVVWIPGLWRGATRSVSRRAIGFEAYIATTVALMAQYTEQWAAHLPATIMRLFPAAYPAGVSYTEHALIAAFPLGSSALFLLGALAFYYRHPAGEGAAWLLFVWALLSAASPFAYLAFGSGSGIHYIGGMATAPILIACGVRGIRRLRAASPPARERIEDHTT